MLGSRTQAFRGSVSLGLASEVGKIGQIQLDSRKITTKRGGSVWGGTKRRMRIYGGFGSSCVCFEQLTTLVSF